MGEESVKTWQQLLDLDVSPIPAHIVRTSSGNGRWEAPDGVVVRAYPAFVESAMEGQGGVHPRPDVAEDERRERLVSECNAPRDLTIRRHFLEACAVLHHTNKGAVKEVHETADGLGNKAMQRWDSITDDDRLELARALIRTAYLAALGDL